MRRASIACAVFMMPIAAFGCEATKANFEKVKIGMTLPQVEAAIGCAGDVMQETEGGGLRLVMYKWDGAAPGSSLIVMLQNGKLTSRQQFGLH